MQSLALSTASSSASAAAAAAANGCSSGASSAARAASQARAAARSARQAMVAHRCLTAWNEPIGRPNWRRIPAYPAAVSLHQAATPAASAANRVAARSRTRSRVKAGAELVGGMARVEPDGGQVAGEVDRGEAGDRDAGLVQLEDEPGAVLGAGEEGAAGRQDRAGLAGHACRRRAGQRAGGERDRGRFPGQEAGEHGGQDRARGQRAGQRLQRGGQVGDRAVPRDGEDAHRLQVVHERGDVLPGADGGDGAGPLGPVAERCLQGLLLLSHRDRQSLLPSV